MFDRHAIVALIITVVLLITAGVGLESAVGYLNIYLEKKPVPMREQFDNIAMRLGEWAATATSQKYPEEMIETLGTREYLERAYHYDGEDARFEGVLVNLHTAYYTGFIDAVPHVPARCLVAGGFNIRVRPEKYPLDVDRSAWTKDPEHVLRATGEPYDLVSWQDPITLRTQVVRMPEGDFVLDTTEFSHKDFPESRIYGGYFFIANGRLTSSPGGVKVYAFMKSVEYAYYCKVQFVVAGPKSLTPEGFTAIVTDLLEPLLPELMRCLPDWSEVEGWSNPAPDFGAGGAAQGGGAGPAQVGAAGGLPFRNSSERIRGEMRRG